MNYKGLKKWMMRQEFSLMKCAGWGKLFAARAHGMWTYKSRQGRNAATVVCSASAVVTLAFNLFWNVECGMRTGAEIHRVPHFAQ
ncbi:hypothetical protein Cflav_PD1542 [Pedosphaera parvula Ellin514]|uniref:Uncharacterized protein n=1 Tax=Pedosphaera parvula (strain Ellin514) TaxID=320771 RepID=B9XNI2_PEDPL|nr:hypothetical protein Cflav_PD1542 [Pedosphaera parvula Ellin514]